MEAEQRLSGCYVMSQSQYAAFHCLWALFFLSSALCFPCTGKKSLVGFQRWLLKVHIPSSYPMGYFYLTQAECKHLIQRGISRWETRTRKGCVQTSWKMLPYEGDDCLEMNVTLIWHWLLWWEGDARSNTSYCFSDQLLVLMKWNKWFWISYAKKKKERGSQLIWQVRQNISQISSTFNCNKMWWVKFLCVLVSAGMGLQQPVLLRAGWLKLYGLKFFQKHNRI